MTFLSTSPGKDFFALILLFLIGLACAENIPKNEIVIAVEAFPSSMDPRLGSDLASDRLYALIYRGLFKINDKMEPEPDLAQSYERISPVHYRLKLRQNLRFSDGKPFTSEDAVFTLSSIIRDNSLSPKKGELSVISRLELVDTYTLDIILSSPSAPFLTLLNFGILPKDSGFALDTPPPGLGPYKVTAIKRGQDISLESNPYAEEKPRSGRIVLKVIEDPALRALELKRGSVDVVVNDLPPDSVFSFEKNGFTVSRFPGTNYSYIGINCRKKPLDNPNVRKAISMAIDRRSILKNILRGYGREATGMLSPENWAYCKTPNFPYDPKNAEMILEKEGVQKDEEGIRLKLSYKTSLNKISQFVAEAILENLRPIGIILEIQSLEWGSFYGDVKKGNFDLFSLNWIGIKDPDAFRLRFDSRSVPPFGFNRGGYSNTNLDKLLRQGSSECEKEKRKETYADIQKIVADDSPYINLWWPDIVAVSNSRIEPFVVPPDGSFTFVKDLKLKNHS
jgi:peptide/nickel transport system substrate-binding protein